MLYIKNNSLDPHYNLAFEEYIFSSVVSDESILILWQNEPAVIIGNYQNTLEEINADYIRKNNIHVVRRMTGGGAVYHDLGNLNYSLIVPVSNLEFDFKTFTAPLVETLKNIGIDAEQTGRNDVTIDGKKFSGNAQHHAKGRLLHHGTILFDADLDHVSEALNVRVAKIQSKSTKSVRSRVTNITPYLREPLTLDAFRSLLVNHFNEREPLTEYHLTPADLRNIDVLTDEKYRQWDWNYGRSPACNMIKSGHFTCGFIDFNMDIKNHIIADMHIFGDFFCSRNLDEFTAAFIGIPYERAAIEKALLSIDSSSFFQGIKNDEILDILL